MQGLELELVIEDRLGLLADITRIFRENSLCIKRAEISTIYGMARDTFYVTDAAGNPVDHRIVAAIRQQVGQNALRVQQNKNFSAKPNEDTTLGFLLNNLFKLPNFK